MAEITILLPSLRPDAVTSVIRAFSLTNSSADYEIVVVSPFKITGEKVVHLFEKERRGVIHAIMQAYKEATGGYVVAWSDDAYPESNCLSSMVNFLKTRDDPFVGSFRKRDTRGREMEQWSVYGKLYACWLCASRGTINKVGGFFDSKFKNYWADPDLSLRVWNCGGKVEVCPDAWIRVAQISDAVKISNLKSSFDADTEVFFERWHPQFGGNSRKDWTEVNTPIPHSFCGRVRRALRKVPCLKKIKRLLLRFALT